jgi:hypothetical protein
VKAYQSNQEQHSMIIGTQDPDSFVSDKVKSDIKEFLHTYWSDFNRDAYEYDDLDITFATNDRGDTWNYQTGDNSFTGACYCLPHWAVTTITTNSDIDSLYDDIINQLEDAVASVC